MNLVDTSVWADFLRGVDGPATTYVREQLTAGGAEIALSEPITMELLAGATSPLGLARLEQLSDSLTVLTIKPELDYTDAAAIYRHVRRAGETVRRLNDCLIAAVALRHDATLVHMDADFEAIARAVPLKQVSFR